MKGSLGRKPLQVLLHGGTYDHKYWDWPSDSLQPSYVRAMTEAGYATLKFIVSVLETAVILRTASRSISTLALLQSIRSSNSFERATFALKTWAECGLTNSNWWVSLGSFIATIEGSTYQDVDAVVLTAYSHTLGPAAIASFSLAYPANFSSELSRVFHRATSPPCLAPAKACFFTRPEPRLRSWRRTRP